MSNNVSVKTNFTAGQVSPLIYGRGDLGILRMAPALSKM